VRMLPLVLLLLMCCVCYVDCGDVGIGSCADAVVGIVGVDIVIFAVVS